MRKTSKLFILFAVTLLLTNTEGMAQNSVAAFNGTQPGVTPQKEASQQNKHKSKPKKVTPTPVANNAADLARIEEYLNGLRNISADFLQIDDMGGMMNGKISISRRDGRSGRMRVTYDAPNKDFIVADGTLVSIWNDDMQSQTNVPQGESLAEFILRSPLKLSGDIKVLSLKYYPAKIELALAQKDDEASGTLVLVFEDKPLRLRQWKVIGPDGHMTGVTLQNVREDVTFSDNTFHFVPPNFGKTGR